MFSNQRLKRIEWGDCDPAGIVWNPRYYEMFDAASMALFEKALGISKREMFRVYNCAGLPLVKNESQFKSPAQYGDDVIIESTITFGRSSFQVEHRIMLGDQLCVEARETRVWTVRDEHGALKSSPIPAPVLKAFHNGQRG